MRAIGFQRASALFPALAVAIIILGMVTAVAEAAAPGWKVLAASGPTNLPPVQSEVQRVAVEAEGGSFTLTAGFAAKIVNKSLFGTFSTQKDDPVATINSLEGGQLEVGSRVVGGGLPEEGETFVESCTPTCEPGSQVTFSRPAERSASEEFAVIYTKQALVKEGEVPVGREINSPTSGVIAPGTTVDAVEGNSLTLSRPTAAGYFLEEVVTVEATETTPPLSFNASASEVQRAFQSLPFFSSDGVSVSGGPGGVNGQPYLLMFGGNLANRDVADVAVDSSGLSGRRVETHVFTLVPGGRGTGEISISPVNVGSVTTLGRYTVRVGPLPRGVVMDGPAYGKENREWDCDGGPGDQSFVCTSEKPILPLSVGESIIVPITVLENAEGQSATQVAIEGGNAGSASVQMPIRVSSQPASQGVSAFVAGAFDADGQPESQAGGHPYSALASFLLNTVRFPNGVLAPAGDLKTALVDLPPGFSGNPLATPRCPQSQLTPPDPKDGESPACGKLSQIGVFQPTITSFGESPPTFRVAIFNDVPPPGYAAEFTTQLAFPLQSLLASVRSSEDAGIRISAFNVPVFLRVFGGFAALEGFPAGSNGAPFLSNPTSCAESSREVPAVQIQTETWQQANVLSIGERFALPAVNRCAALKFNPSFSFRPSNANGSSGTGAAAVLHIPQEGLRDPKILATPNLKKAVVRLPSGLTLNASAANGLQSCSEQQIGFKGSDFPLPNPIRFDEVSPTCPDGSKLGIAEVNSPLVESPLKGTIYLAAQEENPFNSLLAIYVVIDDARTGITLKLPGEIQADPTTGQLTAAFDHNPQLAFEDLKLVFRGGGPHSELATPEVCGHYETTGELEPWSAPESGPPAQIKEGGFNISSNCASSAAARPFAPTVEAGTTGTQAGAYSPVVIKVNRKDGEQELKSLDFTLPKGLLGRIAGIPYCSEAAIRNAESKSGKAEQAAASCPAASQIGSVDTAAGVGTEPFHVDGKVYFAGPYKGAPLSSVVITPAVAGPFDLGDVVIRAPLYVDPETAQITAKSDQIPTILKGIPLKVRSVAIYLNRPDFTLNPTSCEPMSVTTSIQGSNGGKAAPSNRFQVGGCKALGFKPKLKINLKGSTTRTGHPALKAVLTYPKKGAYANIARAQVNLPHSEFLDQGNLNKTCTKPVLLEGKCPRSSIYGRATAWTPLLEKPVQGPVYLVGGYGYKLPALVADLDGQIRVVLKGKVDTGKNKGIRNTFEAVPDAPVSRFVLQLKGGKKYGLLENSENLCKKPQRAVSSFTAQNGLVRQIKTRIARQCGKKGKKARHGGRKH